MLLLVAAPMLFFTCFLVRQKLIEHEMEERLEDAAVQTIVVNREDVVWLKKNKEVTVDGKLFDVRSYTITGNKISLSGLFDNEEEELHAQLDNFLHQKNDNSSPLAHLFIKLIFPPLYNTSPSSLFSHNTLQSIARQLFPYQENIIFKKYSSLVGPPPKFV